MDTADRTVFQINLQESLGGGEIYTRFLTAALHSLGWQTTLFVNPRARFWRSLGLGPATIVPVSTLGEIEAQLEGLRGQSKPLVITHSVLAPDDAARFVRLSRLTGLVHMPLYDRFPEGLRPEFNVENEEVMDRLFMMMVENFGVIIEFVAEQVEENNCGIE